MKSVKVNLTIKESNKKKIDYIKRCDKSVSISKILDKLIADEYNKLITDIPIVADSYCRLTLTISQESREMMEALKANGVNISSMLDKYINEYDM